VSLGQHFRPAELERRPRAGLPLDDRLRIADGDRTVVGQRPIEHRAEVVLVARCEDGHVGKQPHVAEVVGAVVRGAVGPGEPGPIHHEYDRQVL